MTAVGELPKVTVAILAFNRRDALAANLRSVHEALDYPRERLEVIVVDNASSDGTADMVRERFPEVTLIESPVNTGIAGWNLAFARGSGDWFLVLDDDCLLAGEGLRRAVVAARDHGADLVSFAVDSSEPGAVFSDFYETGLLLFWGCSVLVSRRALEAVGGFDDGLFIWAHEVEWTMRFLDAGLRHLHMPEIRSVHMKGLPGVNEFGNTRNIRNFAYVAVKLMRPRDAAVTLVNLVVRALLDGIRYPGLGRPALAGIAEGARAGARVRRPVSAAVSRLYRRNCIEFSSHLRPWPRLRHVLLRFRPGTDFRHHYWRGRPRLYPRSAATLRMRGG
jgi:GT2 family glycosyltransferase